ncbi:SigB/SigF/SigG family RNA polymerase sigma factor [Nocardia brasiliensis]|uniref:SigB/SigF/SigG family RNA polymerase sigma factor n=1 Tax=Nocardia brasiliensis TaxID=37326 RepID=UPI002453FBB9|nr:SigB/SigF/SigG family RNA polymerase sigma factor [Nocardia brasiliensis]
MTVHTPPAAAARPAQRHRGKDSYDGIEPLLTQLADLDPGSREHACLREQIQRRCLPLADHIARRYTGRGENYADLYQVACVGLVAAIDRFDPTRRTPFTAFAIPTIMGEVRRYFRDYGWSVRVPRRTKEIQLTLAPAIEKLCHRLSRMPTAIEVAVELDIDLTEVTQAMLAANAYNNDPLDTSTHDNDSEYRLSTADTLGAEDPGYQLTDDALAITPLLDKLPPRDRLVLHLRFFRGQTQLQIAEQLGVSQMQISRILTRTLAQLREWALPDD